MLWHDHEKNGMVRAWHGRGMASVNQTRPHCVNQMGKTHSKPLAARHGRGMAWARHAMCESALRLPGFLDNEHMKVRRFSSLLTGRLYLSGNIPGSHSLLACSALPEPTAPPYTPKSAYWQFIKSTDISVM